MIKTRKGRWNKHGGYKASAFEGSRKVGEIQATKQWRGGQQVLDVAYIEALRTREGIGTKLYEQAAQDACEKGLMLASAKYGRNVRSGGFWSKQERKGRTVEIAEDVLAIPCDYASDLSALNVSPDVLPWILGAGIGLAVLGIFAAAKKGVSVMTASNRTIRYPGGSYTLDDEDLLWLRRALTGEVLKEPDAPRIAEVLLNRYAYLRSVGNTAYPTFARFVRAYAQPINPIWMDVNAAGCKRSPNRCTPALLKKRWEHATRTSFPAWVDDAIERALTRGPADIPRNATHYAGYNVSSNMIQLTPHTPGYNTLWTEGAQARWNGYSLP